MVRLNRLLNIKKRLGSNDITETTSTVIIMILYKKNNFSKISKFLGFFWVFFLQFSPFVGDNMKTCKSKVPKVQAEILNGLNVSINLTKRV